jgi:FkbM family methyltransferase
MANEAGQPPADWIGSWAGSLACLAAGGLPFETFIDLGCAEGYHSLALWHTGLLRGKTIVNVDANSLYQPSLEKIQRAVGGHYRICAVADRSGTVQMHSSAHPYWASAAEPGNDYWGSVNQQLGEKKSVPSRTLDALVAELLPAAPYVLKLDLQGFEARALRSGPRTLENTAVVVCEILTPAFGEINAALDEAGFDLFDVTNVHRADDGRLGWFDAVYLRREYARFNPSRIWADERNEAVRELQLERQRQVQGWIDAILAQQHSAR